VIVNDSLIALSKRNVQIATFVNDELSQLNNNLTKSSVYSEERKTNTLMQYQQYAVANFNNLALMLVEVLEQMQEQKKVPNAG